MVRIHTIKNPGSGNSGTSLCLGEIHLLEIKSARVETLEFPDSCLVDGACGWHGAGGDGMCWDGVYVRDCVCVCLRACMSPSLRSPSVALLPRLLLCVRDCNDRVLVCLYACMSVSDSTPVCLLVEHPRVLARASAYMSHV